MAGAFHTRASTALQPPRPEIGVTGEIRGHPLRGKLPIARIFESAENRFAKRGGAETVLIGDAQNRGPRGGELRGVPHDLGKSGLNCEDAPFVIPRKSRRIENDEIELAFLFPKPLQPAEHAAVEEFVRAGIDAVQGIVALPPFKIGLRSHSSKRRAIVALIDEGPCE
jgi:hypothetical protein